MTKSREQRYHQEVDESDGAENEQESVRNTHQVAGQDFADVVEDRGYQGSERQVEGRHHFVSV